MELGVTGFLCSVGLQTKRRCFFCCRLIIIRGAQLLSAPLLTLFSQHYWSVLSRPRWNHRHVHIQIHYPVIRKAVSWFDWDESEGKQSDFLASGRQNGFQFSWLLLSRVWKGTPLRVTVLLLFGLSQLCQEAEFCLVWKETILSRYCSAFHQLLTELMLPVFALWTETHQEHWVICLPINMFVLCSEARFFKICWPTVYQFCCVKWSCSLLGLCKSNIWLDSRKWIKSTFSNQGSL